MINRSLIEVTLGIYTVIEVGTSASRDALRAQCRSAYRSCLYLCSGIVRIGISMQ